MIILKKIAGFLLILLAGLLSLVVVNVTLEAIVAAAKETKDSGLSSGIAYMLGSLVVIVLTIFFIIYLIKSGSRLIKNKTEAVDSIDDIGKEV